MNLTRLIRIQGNEFLENFKINHQKQNDFKHKRLLYKVVSNPSSIGTFSDQYINYLAVGGAEYFSHISAQISYELIVNSKSGSVELSKLIKRLVSNEATDRDFSYITLMIEFYRSGNRESLEFAIRSLMNKSPDENLIIDIKNMKPLLIEQYIKYVKNSQYIINPIFGSNFHNIKADGDIIIDGSLVEMKCSKYSEFKPEYLCQLMAYYFLNKKLDNPFAIKSFTYWNPLYDIFETISISYSEDLEQKFWKVVTKYNI